MPLIVLGQLALSIITYTQERSTPPRPPGGWVMVAAGVAGALLLLAAVVYAVAAFRRARSLRLPPATHSMRSEPPDIIPVVLEGLPVRPPPELAHLHFDDPTRHVLAATQADRA